MIYGLFFISGACGLIYQVVGVRLFGLVFGNTIYSSSTVLAAFMAGLAVGSVAGGAFLAKRPNKLAIYAILELGIGLTGACMPLAVQAGNGVYAWYFQVFSPSPAMLTFVRFIISFSTLIVPASLMGATLPVISECISENTGKPATVIGWLYGLNTLGAFIGCYSAGFILIGRVGIVATGCIAAALNCAIAGTAFLWNKRFKFSVRAETTGKTLAGQSPRSVTPATGRLRTALFITALLSGFASLALEVAWFKALSWIMGMDSYAFAGMLSVVLSGIGLGSVSYSLFVKKLKPRALFLSILFFCAGIAIFGSIAGIFLAYDIGLSIMKRQDWAELLKPLAATLGNAAENGALALIKTGLLIFMPAIVMFAPALIMGLTFPAMADLFISQSGNVGKGAGTIYGINTIGAIFGPLCIGFLILPAAGLFRSIAIMGGLFFLSGYVMLFSSVKEDRRKAIFVGALFSVIALALLAVMPMDFRKIVEKTLREDDSRLDEELVYFKEGASGDVMVKKSSRYGKEMYINGLQVASSGAHDLHSHVYPAHCIAFMKEKLDDVCLVAFGCGGTAGSFLLYDEVKHLDAVEICDGVIAPARRFFSDMNRGVFNDPRFNLIIQDGKNHIKMTDKRYDVIYTGPIHPQSNQGSAALYTREYFEDCGKKLKDDGLQCLWLPLHMASTGDFKTIVKTFLSVYPHAALFVLPNTVTSSRHVHLLGSNAPIGINYKLISERIGRPAVAADLSRLGENGFSSPCEFAAQFAMSDAALAQWTDSIRTLNTDDRPVVEFYDRRNSDIVPTIKSKMELLGEISLKMENPLSHIIIPPDDGGNTELQNVVRIAEADKALLNGHMASEYLPLFQETSGQYQKIHAFMIGNYRKAYELMPENLFLENYFQK